MQTADRRAVELSIAENRLRVDLARGSAEYRRPGAGARWRACALEEVRGPNQKKPYHRVTFTAAGRRYRCLLHRLVWFAAGRDIAEEMELNHKDGNKLHCSLENLELASSLSNNLHAIRTGLHDPRAPKNWSLDEASVRVIRKRLDAGETGVALAMEYGVSTNCISRIRLRRTYDSVK